MIQLQCVILGFGMHPLHAPNPTMALAWDDLSLELELIIPNIEVL